MTEIIYDRLMKDYVFTFGKYSRRTAEWVASRDPDYIRWAMNMVSWLPNFAEPELESITFQSELRKGHYSIRKSRSWEDYSGELSEPALNM